MGKPILQLEGIGALVLNWNWEIRTKSTMRREHLLHDVGVIFKGFVSFCLEVTG